MTSLEDILEPLRHSPQLPRAMSLLQQQMEEESARRTEFYREMTPEEKVEFIDGEVILHSPAKNRHLDVTLQIATLLKTHVSVKKLGTVKSEKCLCVFPRNDYEPDVVFFGLEKAAELSPDTLKFPPPDLVVEVLSESTETRDRGVKFEDFEVNQVGEYWIVDADESTVEQYVIGDDGFELKIKSSSGILRSVVIDGFECDVEALFDEQKNLKALHKILN